MKTMSLTLLTAIAFLNQSAFAQTTTNSNVASGKAATTSTAIKPIVRYTGIVRGPGLGFSGANQANNNGKVQLNYEQRLGLFASFSDDINAGIETRMNLLFGKGEKVNATAGNFRLLANFRNAIKADIFTLNLTPRLILPTSTNARNQKLTISPDLIVDLAIAPRNTRFSFDTGIEYIQMYHTTGATGADYTNAVSTQLAPWAEIDYQLTDKVQLTASYWPTLNAYARQGRPLANVSNEIDVGTYIEIAKGWQLNPFVAFEPNQMDKKAPQNNMQAMLVLSGRLI